MSVATMIRNLLVPSLLIGLLLLTSAVTSGAEETATENEAVRPDLATTQETIEMKYRRFEATLQQLSEYLRKTDPARAELLIRAIGKSKEGRVADQLQTLTDLLKKDQLGDAIDRQQSVIAEFQTILELLMSEARKDELESRKQWTQEMIKDVNKLIGKQIDARAETERGGSSTQSQSRQKQVNDSTEQLLKKIKDHDGKSGKKDSPESDSKPDRVPSKEDATEQNSKGQSEAKKGNPSKKSDQPSKDSPPQKDSEGKKSDSDPKNDEKESKPEDDAAKPGEDPKPAEKDSEKEESKDSPKGGKNSQNQKQTPSKGKPKPGQQPSQEQPQQEQQDEQQEQNPDSQEEQPSEPKNDGKTPGRSEIQKAKREMDRAIEELKKNSKKGASEKQDKAIAALAKAKEQLEKILTILRQEEREMVLGQLEARFRDMLQKQEEIYNSTASIHSVPVDDRTERHNNRAIELSRLEADVTLQAEKALTLLKEEGSSIAMPEAVEQIRDDMITITRRLEKVDVGEITQNVEQDVIEGLKEIIEAMQKEMEKMKDQKQQPPSQQQQKQQKQEQVNKLAELKMLRSLQFRVNRRTRQLGRQVEGEQALDPDLIGQLQQLADRQAKVQKATNDLATGKNQ